MWSERPYYGYEIDPYVPQDSFKRTVLRYVGNAELDRTQARTAGIDLEGNHDSDDEEWAQLQVIEDEVKQLLETLDVERIEAWKQPKLINPSPPHTLSDGDPVERCITCHVFDAIEKR
ncbi:hypothetical protein G6011_05820 [Alternaria panax]|uniref:Uncharacterized protein n=1 Tax=Alternaria panax TaxID=48097 RepID=A0AAD4I7N0_9PLEO|nr:hypothetical protein G6011_05820 [Alternaria panax]